MAFTIIYCCSGAAEELLVVDENPVKCKCKNWLSVCFGLGQCPRPEGFAVKGTALAPARTGSEEDGAVCTPPLPPAVGASHGLGTGGSVSLR